MNILFVFSDTGTSKKQNVFKKSFMQSSTNCNVHLTESIFQTHSRTWKRNKFQIGGVKMKAVRMYAPRDLRVEEVDIPSYEADVCLIIV